MNPTSPTEQGIERNLCSEPGAARVTAQPSAFHTALCLNGPCPHDCAAAIADGLARDPDWTRELPGQVDLLALLEEAS